MYMKIILNVLIAGLLLVHTAYMAEAIVMTPEQETEILFTIVNSPKFQQIEELLKKNLGIAHKRLLNNQTILMIASLHNKPQIVQVLVKYHNNGGNIGLNEQEKGWTALMCACSKKENAPIVSMLLKAHNIDASLTTSDNKKQTALMIACLSDNLPAVKALLQYYKEKEGNNIAINAKSQSDDLTALMMACQNQQRAQIVSELLGAQGINAAAIIPTTKYTALMIACLHDNLKAVQALVRYHNKNGDIGLNEPDAHDVTALMLACYKPEQAPIVSELLGAQGINAATSIPDTKHTALMIACLHNNLSAVQDFVQYHNHGGKIALNAQSNNGTTALMKACQDPQKIRIVLALLNARDIEAATIIHDTQYTTLMVACYHNNFPAVQALLKHYAKDGTITLNVNVQNITGMTALMIACEDEKNIAILHELLKVPNINATLLFFVPKYTALLMACSKSNLAAVQALLQYYKNDPSHDIALNAQSLKGWTALMIACDSAKNDARDVKIVEALLSTNGIDATLTFPHDKCTALMTACQNNLVAIPAFIQYHKNGGKIALNAQDIMGWTALMKACNKDVSTHKDYDLKLSIEQLLSLQDINANITVGKDNYTAFTIACFNHNPEILSAFLEISTAYPGKINLNVQVVSTGKTGLILAASSNPALTPFVKINNPYIDYNLRDNDENNAFMIAATTAKISYTNLHFLFNKTSKQELDICNVFGENAWNILYKYYDIKGYFDVTQLVKNLITSNVVTQENVEANCLNEQTKQQLITLLQAQQAKAKNVTPTKDVEKSPVSKRQKITINDLAKIYQEKSDGYLQDIQKGLNRLIIDAKINQPVPIDFQIPISIPSLHKTWLTTFPNQKMLILDMHHIVNISVQVTPEIDGTLTINWRGGHAYSTIQAAINAGLIQLIHKIDMDKGCIKWNLRDVITQKTFIKTTFPEPYNIQKIYGAIKYSSIQDLAPQPQDKYNKITNNLTQINAVSGDKNAEKIDITIVVDNDPESTLLQAITAYPVVM